MSSGLQLPWTLLLLRSWEQQNIRVRPRLCLFSVSVMRKSSPISRYYLSAYKAQTWGIYNREGNEMSYHMKRHPCQFNHCFITVTLFSKFRGNIIGQSRHSWPDFSCAIFSFFNHVWKFRSSGIKDSGCFQSTERNSDKEIASNLPIQIFWNGYVRSGLNIVNMEVL